MNIISYVLKHCDTQQLFLLCESSSLQPAEDLELLLRIIVIETTNVKVRCYFTLFILHKLISTNTNIIQSRVVSTHHVQTHAKWYKTSPYRNQK